MKIEGRHELQAASLERPVTGEEATVVLVKAISQNSANLSHSEILYHSSANS